MATTTKRLKAAEAAAEAAENKPTDTVTADAVPTAAAEAVPAPADPPPAKTAPARPLSALEARLLNGMHKRAKRVKAPLAKFLGIGDDGKDKYAKLTLNAPLLGRTMADVEAAIRAGKGAATSVPVDVDAELSDRPVPNTGPMDADGAVLYLRHDWCGIPETVPTAEPATGAVG